MPPHIVLLLEPNPTSNNAESRIAVELENAGYRVVTVRSFSMAAAIVFIDHRVKAVVIEAAIFPVAVDFSETVWAIRPGILILTTAKAASNAAVIRALDSGFGRCAG
jgi:hypothetical protein